MDGRDILGLAQTGTGKTAAFALPLIHALETDRERAQPKSARSLILAPTRELANQIAEAIADLAQGANLKTTVAIGGASMHAQRKRLGRGVDILIATPGRLLDLLDRDALTLAHAQWLVLDEADQMLDMGFIHALRKIAPLLPADRRTLLFSATMPKQMAELASTYLNNPVRIEVAPAGKAADGVNQSVHFVHQSEKLDLLKEALNGHLADRALVFARTKRGAERLSEALWKDGFAVDCVHGDRRQRERTRAIDDFRSGRIRILVATDVAARGIDIPDVAYVYNFELPNVPELYVHRIGRTARAGAKGEAISFCAMHEMGDLAAIERAMRQPIDIASGQPWRKGGSKPAPRKRPAGGGRPGGRKPGRPQKQNDRKPAATAHKERAGEGRKSTRRRKPKPARNAA